MKTIYRFFYSLMATLLFVVVYLIKEKLSLINYLFPAVPKNAGLLGSFLVYLITIILLTAICAQIQKNNSDTDSLKNIKEIEYADSIFLPSYLGFFFVALSSPSITDEQGIIITTIVFLLLFSYSFFSRTAYNPMLFILGYKFYYVRNTENVKILLITKRNMKRLSDCNCEKVHRINNYTFIEI